MKERPILFSGPMVRALLAGTKTQTRRVVKPAPDADQVLSMRSGSTGFRFAFDMANFSRTRRLRWDIPFGQPGDRLWVREAHSIHYAHGQHRADGMRCGPWGGLPMAISPDLTQAAYYREGFDRCDAGRWRPSIHMPRWASRLTLEITGVRVERLQDISEADAIAEGWPKQIGPPFPPVLAPASWYRALWESINGPGSWDANPWVWVVEFGRLP